MISRIKDLVFDCHEPGTVASFWASLLGGTVETFEAVGDQLVLVPGQSHRIWFQPVPEAKTVKNRVHLDVTLEPGQSVEDVIALGASVVALPEEIGERWTVLADPEGNEFCVFPQGG